MYIYIQLYITYNFYRYTFIINVGFIYLVYERNSIQNSIFLMWPIKIIKDKMLYGEIVQYLPYVFHTNLDLMMLCIWDIQS